MLLIELDDLKIILYWHTPYDQNLFENSFGIGFYDGELKTGSELLERTQCLPNSIPEGLKFKKQLAKDGPLSVDIDGNYLIDYLFNWLNIFICKVVTK